jgi:hypothetical protein
LGQNSNHQLKLLTLQRNWLREDCTIDISVEPF